MNLYFLKLDALRGESCAARHFGEIELTGLTWGDSHKAATAGIGAGKASVSDVVLFKKADRTSNEFMLASADGRHFKEARLTVERVSESGGLLQTVSINMKSILVNTFKAVTDAPPAPLEASEEIGLKFGQMELVDSEKKQIKRKGLNLKEMR